MPRKSKYGLKIGTLIKNRKGCFYWRGTRPGETKVSTKAMVPTGADRATKNVATAKAIAKVFIETELLGNAPAAHRNDAMTLLDMFSKATHDATDKTIYLQTGRCRTFLTDMKIGTVFEITTPKVRQFLAMTMNLSPATRNGYLTAVSRFCVWLKDAKNILEHNPAYGVKRASVEARPHERWLSPVQCKQAINLAIGGGIGNEVILAIQTGLRAGELRLLKWSMVHTDVEGPFILLSGSICKSSRARSVPLGPEALAALRNQRWVTGQSEWVFPAKTRAFSNQKPAGDRQSFSFSRKEFYERVWNTSAVWLADELGCSDVMIGKHCTRMNIPKPGVGYWKKFRSGKKVKRTPLPRDDRPEVQRVTFSNGHLTADSYARPYRPAAPEVFNKMFQRVVATPMADIFHTVDRSGRGWHMLRHTYATLSLMNTPITIQQLSYRMGHRNIETTQRYAHMQMDHGEELDIMSKLVAVRSA